MRGCVSKRRRDANDKFSKSPPSMLRKVFSNQPGSFLDQNCKKTSTGYPSETLATMFPAQTNDDWAWKGDGPELSSYKTVPATLAHPVLDMVS